MRAIMAEYRAEIMLALRQPSALAPSPYADYIPPPPRKIAVSERMLEKIADAAGSLGPADIGPALGLTPQEWGFMNSHPQILTAIAQGEARAKLRAGRAIQQAIEAGDARIAFDYMTHKGGWRKQTEADANEIAKAQTMIDLSQLSDEELDKLAELTAKLSAPKPAPDGPD